MIFKVEEEDIADKNETEEATQANDWSLLLIIALLFGLLLSCIGCIAGVCLLRACKMQRKISKDLKEVKREIKIKKIHSVPSESIRSIRSPVSGISGASGASIEISSSPKSGIIRDQSEEIRRVKSYTKSVQDEVKDAMGDEEIDHDEDVLREIETETKGADHILQYDENINNVVIHHSDDSDDKQDNESDNASVVAVAAASFVENGHGKYNVIANDELAEGFDGNDEETFVDIDMLGSMQKYNVIHGNRNGSHLSLRNNNSGISDVSTVQMEGKERRRHNERNRKKKKRRKHSQRKRDNDV